MIERTRCGKKGKSLLKTRKNLTMKAKRCNIVTHPPDHGHGGPPYKGSQ